MLIGKQYSDNKLYRGVRHYDRLPLSSEDLHETSDTLYKKNAYIMNNIIGYGILNSPRLSISSTGIRMQEPAVLLIDGDISLVQSDDNVDLISINEISTAGYSSGSICIVGWYQQITASSTMRNYGGVNNSILVNDLQREPLDIQISTRYQFRWVPILLDQSNISSDNISFSLVNRDATGSITSGSTTISSINKIGSVFIAKKPANMDYAVSDLYIIPMIKYSYSNGAVTGSSMYLPAKPKGTTGFVSSSTEPIGEFTDGTVWYNPTSKEFQTYVTGTGFVASTHKMGILQYQSVYVFTTNFNTTQDITIPIGISELQEGDILRVIYEGLTLILGEHYTIDYTNRTITLLGFTARMSEKVTFTAIKVVEV